ncbi:MAG: 5'-methylthioadenosine phosphorylase [Myxococcota bacterium]|jgi:5'-methylthioadenosine phosphorylase
MAPVLGIIGGSGVYEIDGLSKLQWETVASPFGQPSDQLLFGELNGQTLVFLPRHGRGHTLSPGAVNYRANIDVMKRAGVSEILSVSAVGSFKEELAPGTFVVVDQYIDRTRGRAHTFFERGVVAHVSMAHPTCSRLGDLAFTCAKELGLNVVRGGTYLGMEGPQFSSLAESKLYKSWGCDVIGMTNLPEAYLAREAEICYATVGMVTDYDCWHPDHDAVQVAEIVKVLLENADNARSLVKKIAPGVDQFERPCPNGCHRVLDDAIITGPEARDPAVVRTLDAVAGRVLNG